MLFLWYELYVYRKRPLLLSCPILLYGILIVAYLIIPIFMPQGPYYCGKEKKKMYKLFLDNVMPSSSMYATS